MTQSGANPSLAFWQFWQENVAFWTIIERRFQFETKISPGLANATMNKIVALQMGFSHSRWFFGNSEEKRRSTDERCDHTLG